MVILDVMHNCYLCEYILLVSSAPCPLLLWLAGWQALVNVVVLERRTGDPGAADQLSRPLADGYTHSQYFAMTGSNSCPPVFACSFGIALSADEPDSAPVLVTVLESQVMTWSGSQWELSLLPLCRRAVSLWVGGEIEGVRLDSQSASLGSVPPTNGPPDLLIA